jgi:hypothetical protein
MQEPRQASQPIFRSTLLQLDVREDGAKLGNCGWLTLSLGARKSMALRPDQERRLLPRCSAPCHWPVFLDERSPAFAHQKPQASPVRVDLSKSPQGFTSHGCKHAYWCQPQVRLCCVAWSQPVRRRRRMVPGVV